MEQAKEEYAVVLDFLQHGYPFDTRPSHRKTAIVQAIGKRHFTLLELVPKPDVFLQPLQEVYIGEGKREHIHHISGKLPVEKLTATAKAELEPVVSELVENNQTEFVEFFNKAGPLTMRMHQLELLPGLGKKHMWQILEEREEKPFADFDDVRKRIKLMPNPEKAVIKRIIREINGEEKHNLFVDM